MEEDKDETYDYNRAKLSVPISQKNNSEKVPVYHLVTSSERHDLSTVFELDPTIIQRVRIIEI